MRFKATIYQADDPLDLASDLFKHVGWYSEAAGCNSA